MKHLNKNNKLKTLVPLVLLATSSLCGAATMNDMTLEKVTLFLNGAELQGKAIVDVPKGESEVIVTNVGTAINSNSINVGVGNDAMILSTTLKSDHVTEFKESEEIAKLKVTVEELRSQRDAIAIKLSVLDEEITLLKGNRIDELKIKDNTLTDTKNILSFIKENLSIALTERLSLQQQQDEINKRIAKYDAQISAEKGHMRAVGNAIVVKLYSQKATSLPINLTYMSTEAGWIPTYDVRVADIDSPIKLTYKANVYQNTGLDWRDIDFTLSTANPSEGVTAPQLSPWHIYINDYSKYSGVQKAMAPMAMMDMAADYSVKQESARATGAASFTKYVQTNNNGINTQFNIKLPYTVKNYSRDNTIILKEKDVPANYKYVATPKLDQNAFLQASITDWEQLMLLPGQSTVFFAGNYVGQGYITTQGIKDTLDISLGRDKNILISRNQNLAETSKPSFFGNNVSQKFAYTIDVRNTKTSPIDIVIYDQLPVINNKAITLEDMKYDGAEYNKETGMLTWKLQLQPSATRQLPFSFKVTYPKDQSSMIIGL